MLRISCYVFLTIGCAVRILQVLVYFSPAEHRHDAYDFVHSRLSDIICAVLHSDRGTRRHRSGGKQDRMLMPPPASSPASPLSTTTTKSALVTSTLESAVSVSVSVVSVSVSVSVAVAVAMSIAEFPD